MATDPYQLQALAQAVQTLGPKLKAEQSETATKMAWTVLADAHDPRVAGAFARAIAANLPAEPAKPYVTAIVELLKWPTTAGPATEALLEVLHERVPDAPGKEAGLDATVAWVAATYPDIDLDSPPTCPATVCTDVQHDPGLLERLVGMVDPLLARLTDAWNSVRRWIGSPSGLVSPAP